MFSELPRVTETVVVLPNPYQASLVTQVNTYPHHHHYHHHHHHHRRRRRRRRHPHQSHQLVL